MGHMKKSWGKTIKTILGVLVGNLVLSFAVAAFTVPNGIIMGGATGIGLTIRHPAAGAHAAHEEVKRNKESKKDCNKEKLQ